MKKLLRSFPVAAALLLPLVPAPELSAQESDKTEEKASRRVSIETISDLKLSGFNDDDRGELQWTLRAESATADGASASADIRRTLWNLHKLQLSTFAKDGGTFAEMTSPSGKFSPEKRTAESDARVEVKGADFYVRGNGWSWSGRGHDNLIRVHHDVFVSINLPEKKPKADAKNAAKFDTGIAAGTPNPAKTENSAGTAAAGTATEDAEKLTALSEQLTIKGSDKETTLIFAGSVKISYGDIFMSCDSLEIVVPATSSANSDGNAGAGEAKKIAQAVRRIAGRGNLEITRGPLRLSGRSAEFLPQKNIFNVRGNATLANTVSLLFVRGDEATGRLDENFVEVRAVKSAGTGTKNADTTHGTVSIEMPSFVEKKSSAAGTTSGGRTLITGDRLTVFNAENENVISLFGNIVAADGNIKINADTLAVTTEPTVGNALDAAAESGGTARRNEFSKIRVIAAAGNVRAEYSGRVLSCGRVDVFPQENQILLSEAPQIVSEEEDATLSGERAEVRLDRDEIAVFGSEGDDPERRRVLASLPPFSGKELAAGTQNFSAKSAKNAKKTAETPAAGTPKSRTELRGDVLTLTRDADVSTFDFAGDVSLNSDELDGSCGRITVFADPKRPKKSAARGAKDELSQIKKIVADKNVRLEQNGYELTGGRAVVTPGIALKEWIEDDANAAADGRTPFLITVEPDADTGTRPRIRFPGGETGTALGFALPASAEKSETAETDSEPDSDDAQTSSAGTVPRKSTGFISGKLGESDSAAAGTKAAGTKNASANSDIFGGADLPLTKKYEPKSAQPAAVPAPAAKKKDLPKESYLESDAMELIAGEKRARFFLRGDVILAAGDGAQGMCESVEGLLETRGNAAPSAGTKNAGAVKGSAESNFEAKKVICRGDVRMRHEDSSGRGNTLEIFPPQNRAVLSGHAYFRGKDGITLHPGNDRFVFDLEKRQMITGAEAGADDAVPEQVSRPQIIIPPGGNRVFVVPKSVRGKDK